MSTLDPTLHKLLENKVPEARQFAEEASRSILNILAVNRPEPFPTMSQEQRQLRNALRAKARQLGEGSQTQGFEPLLEELAYHQWHRMVFARFLAENNLLMHPSGVPVTLQECEELAQEEGEIDAWSVAAKYAALMLPGIFREEDPLTKVRFSPEGLQKLELNLMSLPSAIFIADDALGWMYQFWQSRKKEEVKKSEHKIGGADIAPVTQLFTEDYMVRFLLENSLGAWWASRHPNSSLQKEWLYLRFTEDGLPAAGSFSGWPDRISEVTVMDPCCGSGHFLVAAFEMLVQMRMEEEDISEIDATESILRENVFGLELDLRCTQIATFALVLAAWKRGGYRLIPVPNIACSGIPVHGQLDTWLKLAGDDSRIKAGLERLYSLFTNAPDLGSLIDPADIPEPDRMFVADYEQVAPVLEKALAKEFNIDPVAEIFGASAEGVAKAGKLLAKKYTLVITNVPYLVRKKQSEILREHCKIFFEKGNADLATAFVERCRAFTKNGGSYALVTPQNWLFLSSYSKLRIDLLKHQKWNVICRLGSGSKASTSWEKLRGLTIISNSYPDQNKVVVGLDALEATDQEKSKSLEKGPLMSCTQSVLLENPDGRIIFNQDKISELLLDYAEGLQGISPSDRSRFLFFFWEIEKIIKGWELIQSNVSTTVEFGGRTEILNLLLLESNKKILGAAIRGKKAWGKKGVSVTIMRSLPVTIYTGEPFDTNAHVILPRKNEYFSAIWAFCQSSEFNIAVRKLDQKLGVTNSTLVKVPFNYKYWSNVASSSKSPSAPFSNDPTQWLFKGHPSLSTEPLQVAVARLLGYIWPQQKSDFLNKYIDEDGILCLPSVNGEVPAAEKLRNFLAQAYEDEWSPIKQTLLLSEVGYQGKTLEDWLMDGFFSQHCKLFQNRPFIWHIWDGRKDGFSALVNYHKLTSANLERMIYTYLGDWINFQRGRRDHGEPGADGRLVAAIELQNKLKLIREGEPPYDIYVRWKSLADQPIGWDPDLNNGVRLNIRPFVTAGVLRSRFTINWNKDRGKNPDGSERLNDLYFTIAEKQAARRGKA